MYGDQALAEALDGQLNPGQAAAAPDLSQEQLDKALYGHPKAGDIWGAALQEHLQTLGFKPVEGWPSVFSKELDNKKLMMVIANVDDLLFLGSNQYSKPG